MYLKLSVNTPLLQFWIIIGSTIEYGLLPISFILLFRIFDVCIWIINSWKRSVLLVIKFVSIDVQISIEKSITNWFLYKSCIWIWFLSQELKNNTQIMSWSFESVDFFFVNLLCTFWKLDLNDENISLVVSFILFNSK